MHCALSHCPSNSHHPDAAGVVGMLAGQILAINHVERHLIEGSVEGCVVYVLSPRKIENALSRTVTSHTTKRHTDRLVRRLDLVVCKGMEGGAPVELGPQPCEWFFPECQCEHWSGYERMDAGMQCRRTILPKNTCATDSAVYGCPSGVK